MASYKVLIKGSAATELEGFPPKVRRSAVNKEDRVAHCFTPTAGGGETLGQERFPIRQDDCRVPYCADDGVETVTVVKIGHRRNV